jgi:hypothetical protein
MINITNYYVTHLCMGSLAVRSSPEPLIVLLKFPLTHLKWTRIRLHVNFDMELLFFRLVKMKKQTDFSKCTKTTVILT